MIADGDELPVVAFSVNDDEVSEYTSTTSPASCASGAGWCRRTRCRPNREDLVVLRVVVRNGFSHDMAELFLRDLRKAVDWLDDLDAPMPHTRETSKAFSH